MSTPEKNKAMVRCHLKDVLEGGRVELIPETWAPDGSVPGMFTPEGWKETVLWWHKNAPGFKVTILDMLAEAGKVAALIQFDATYSVPTDPPPAQPFPPLGKPVSWKNMFIVTIRDGKIVAEQSLTGWTDMLIEAGINPMQKVTPAG